jgi:Regulator of ribonuclease activity B
VIDREALKEMFDSIAAKGQWDTSQPMLWGYFFTHRDPKRLHDVGPILQSRDYEFVDIFKSEKDDPANADLWWLHVQRVEVHSVDSLFARNEQLDDFAREHRLDSYDGMDTGPAESPERLV